MGKIKEVLEIEDAYTFAEVGKRKAKKIFEDAQLQEKVLTVLQNKGKVFATQEKKEIVCYYLFERVNWEESLKEDGKTKEQSYAYKLVEVYWATEKEWRDSFENSIRANLKENIELGMAEVVIWNEEVYVLDKQKKSFNITGIITGALLGLSFTYSMDNWALGIPMIFMWAMIFNGLFNAEVTKLVKRGE
ncbi:MAG: hypothetical protein IJ455_02715 [Agathobacter sp.]|nr:hypothetical protein [Agathobacter sp.]